VCAAHTYTPEIRLTGYYPARGFCYSTTSGAVPWGAGLAVGTCSSLLVGERAEVWVLGWGRKRLDERVLVPRRGLIIIQAYVLATDRS
jgi:hypothetical protein